MHGRAMDFSPQSWARIGGAIYVVIIVSGFLGELVRASLFVPGDATATLSSIRASEALWRLGIASNLLHLACSLPLALVFYLLLRPVSRSLVILVLLFNVAAVVLEAGSKLFLLPALFVLGNAAYLQPFTPDQLAAMAYLSNKVHAYGFGVSLIFFGCECLLLGYLIYKSQFLPKAIGVLMQVAGLCYLINSFLLLLAPTWANVAVLIPCLIAELSLAVWLLVKGVDLSRWQASTTASTAVA